jgi:hypothetical protein
LQDKEIVPKSYGRLSKFTKPSIIDQTIPKAANPAPNIKDYKPLKILIHIILSDLINYIFFE